MQKKVIFGIIAITVVFSATLLVLLTSFRATNVDVIFNTTNLLNSEGQPLTSDEIISASGVSLGTNVLFLNGRQVEERLTQKFPLARVRLERVIPARINIYIDERVPTFALAIAGSSAKGVLDLDFNFVGFATPAQLDRLILIEGVSFNPQGREPSHFLGRNLKDYAQIAELRYARSVFSYFERVGRSALEIKQNIIRTINVDLTNNRIHMTAQTQVNIEIIGLTRLADKIRYLDAVYDDEVSRQAGEGNLPYLIIRVNLIANEVTVTTQIT